MKIALAQLNYHVGNIEANKTKIIEHIDIAHAGGCDLVVFSELALCGYPPLDLLDFDSFTHQCVKAMQDIATHCKDIAAIIGAPSFNGIEKGKKLFNSAYFLSNGAIQHVVHKSLLPTYDIFDEYRYFEPANSFHTIDYKGTRIALTICEDLWALTRHPLYNDCPMDHLVKLKPDIMINIAASPFAGGHTEERKSILSRNAQKYQLPLVYVNQVGANTDILFDGGSLYMDKQGNTKLLMPSFREELDIINTVQVPEKIIETTIDPTVDIYNALVMGIRDYFVKMGFKKALIGLSGGVDSAIVAALAQRALGSNNVMGVLMPSQFSSDHSVSDAVALAENLGIAYETVAIKEVYDSYMSKLSPLFKDLPFNVAEENLQARVRGVLLMAISNKFGHIVLNTTNKSEMAVGYGTLYGDMCGGISVLGDVYKTQAYKLAGYINKREELIPNNILTKAPSAELRPDQKDTDSLPEYDLLDAILHNYLECALSAQEIVNKGYDEQVVRKVIRMVNNNEYKRYQAAPVLRVTTKAFGAGRVMPLVGSFTATS